MDCVCGHEIRIVYATIEKNGKKIKKKVEPTQYEHTNVGKELRAMKLCGFCGCKEPKPAEAKPKKAKKAEAA